MELRVAELRDTLKLLQPVIPRKTSLPVLHNVLLKDGQVIGTDLETMVKVAIPEIEGECLLPHEEALELLKFVPGGTWLSIVQENGSINLTWEDGKAQYDVPKPKDFPDVRDIKPDSEGTISDGDTMVSTLRDMLVYRSTDESRTTLCGVTVGFGEVMEICAADGFRMAYQTLPLPYPEERRAIMPAGSVSLLCDLWKKAPPPMALTDNLIKQVISKRPLNISLSTERLVARFGKVTLLSNLIQGTPYNFADLVPKDPPIKVSAWAPEMDRCVSRVRDVAKRGTGAVRLSWSDNTMVVSAKHENNSVSAEMKILNTDGSGGRIAVNHKYLSEYLSNKESVVTLAISSENTPLLLRYGKAPLVVIMPMFVDWDGGKPAAQEEPEPETEEVDEETTGEPEDLAETEGSEPVEKPKKKPRRK